MLDLLTSGFGLLFVIYLIYGIFRKLFYVRSSYDEYDSEFHQLATVASKLSSDAYKKTEIEKSLRTLGFDGFDPHNYPDQRERKSGDNLVAYSFAHKDDVVLNSKKYTIIAITVRGTVGSDEWISNFNAGYGAVPDGFKAAEAELYSSLCNYLANTNLANNANNKFFITGHSRGAAVANLLAARLESRQFCQRENLYAYTFATPNVIQTSNSAQPEDKIYNNIINFINAEDIVPYVPLSKWDYWKYGRTFAFPTSKLSTKFDSILVKLATEYQKLSGENEYLYLLNSKYGHGIAQDLTDLANKASQGDPVSLLQKANTKII
jgi:hypothetical protein